MVVDETVADSKTLCPYEDEPVDTLRVVVDVAAGASVTVTIGEVSPLKLLSPRYCAVIELAPAARVRWK